MSNSRIEVAIRALDGDRFERLMADLMEREGYDVRATGTHGADGGRDAFLTSGDRDGILHCSVQKEDWERKAHDDAEKAVENFDRDFDFFVFATTQDPATAKRDRIEEELRETWGMPATIWDFSEIRKALVGGDNGDLIKEHLRVDPKNPWVDIETEVDAVYEEQLERLKRGEAPHGTVVEDIPKLIMHVIPQEAIDDHHDRFADELPNPPQFEKRDSFAQVKPKVKITENNRRSHDGEGRERYTAIHRDGWAEGMLTGLYYDSTAELRTGSDRLLVNFVQTALNMFEEEGIYPPYYVYITILDGANTRIRMPNRLGNPFKKGDTFGKDEIRLNRVRIDDPDVDVPMKMRRSMFQLWRYSGWKRSIHYTNTADGDAEPEWEWNPRR